MRNPPPTLRPMRPEDVPCLCRIFFDAIHEGAAAFYDADQRRAWAPASPDPVDWAARLSEQSVIVAEVEGVIAGFMTLCRDGHVDLAFVAPTHAGQGIGSCLLEKTEREARDRGMAHLTVRASLVARPLFERWGWRVVREQVVERDGVSLTNFAMEKRLIPR